MQASIDREIFIRCCESYIAKCTAIRDEEVNKMANAIMEPRSGFFGKLADFFSPPPSSLEDAHKYLKLTEWYIWVIRPKDNVIYKVNRLRDMAEKSSAPFVVITENEHFLLKYKD